MQINAGSFHSLCAVCAVGQEDTLHACYLLISGELEPSS